MMKYARIIFLLLPLISFNCGRELPSSYYFNSTQSISLTSPEGGEKFTVNQEVGVRWTSININDNLRIELINNDQSVYSINNIPNTGNYLLQIPASITPSEKYQIKIESMTHPEVFDISNSYFEILPSIDGRWYYSNLSEFSGLELDLELSAFVNNSFTGTGYFHLRYNSTGNIINYERTDTVAGLISFPDISFVLREPDGKEFDFVGKMVTNAEIGGRIIGYIDSEYGSLNDTITLVRQ